MARLLLHLFCFVLPITTAAYLLTAPHQAGYAPLWLSVLFLSVLADCYAPPERRQPEAAPLWPFDVVLYLLAGLQLLTVGLLLHHVATMGLWRVDSAVGIVLVGVNSGYSAIVVAHELIHRTSSGHRLLGRLLLVTVLYEHFYTEHVRGHHARIGTREDPATARFGETYAEFRRRTIPAQLRSAWRLETKRLGDVDMPPWDLRLLQSRVVHGLLASAALCVAVLALAGPGALVALAAQAYLAVGLLEAVNWFEHWGIVREGGRVTTMHSWDTESAFTFYTLVGLSRHADHHAHANRPYPQLRHFEDSLKLPGGYFEMVVLAVFHNARARQLLAAELERRATPRTEAA